MDRQKASARMALDGLGVIYFLDARRADFGYDLSAVLRGTSLWDRCPL